MNIRDARQLIEKRHVRKAAQLVTKHGINWLFEKTGREPPLFRYVVVDGVRYPTKAFGFLVAQLAGNTEDKSNKLTTDEAAKLLKNLGYVDVHGLRMPKTRKEKIAKEQSYYSTLARPGQSAFRELLMDAYNGRCAITGVSVEEAIEAAHIKPFSLGGADALSNGILLRVDLHRLFDAGQIAIDPANFKVCVAKGVAHDYPAINNRVITLPFGGPTGRNFKARWSKFA